MRTMVAISVLAAALPAVAVELFVPTRSPADAERTGASRGIKRERGVSIRADRLRPNARMRLRLFDDAVYETALEYAELSADRRTSLYAGRLAGTDHGTAIFAVSGDVTSGIVRAENGRRFLIRSRSGSVRVEEIEEREYPPPEEALLPAAGEWVPDADAICPECDHSGGGLPTDAADRE